jgi:hypothetical protein
MSLLTPKPEGTIYCEFTGQVSEAFRAEGWKMWSVDLLPSECAHPMHAIDDANDFSLGARYDRFAGVHWPCTRFANSGVRWYYGGKGTVPDPKYIREMQRSADGLCLLLRTLRDHGTPFYFENPVMHRFARTEIIARIPWFAELKPQTIQPWNFGVWETKATLLWRWKVPALVVKYRTIDECRKALGLPLYIGDKLNKPTAKVHFTSPGPNRGHERSRTLPELAKAMAEQWGPYLANL